MQHLPPRKKRRIILAVMCALWYAALNQTVIGTIIPRIVSDLGGLEQLSWAFTIFMLASTIATPLAGRFSDRYGRKRLIIIGLTILIIGSVLCGFSRDFLSMVMFRGMQGLGVGIIIALSFTVVGDLFAPRERGRWLGIVTSVYGIASVFGPVAGGYLADHATWRWAFWMFLPIGLAALAFVWSALPSQQRIERQTIDYFGILWLTLAIISLLLALSLGGTHFAWTSTVIIGLFGAALLSLHLFARAERKAAHPIMPVHLFRNRTFVLSSVIGLVSSVCMFGTMMYAPLFIQGVLGTSAAMSGAFIMPLTLGLVAANAAAGWIVSRTGQYKKLALFGLVVMTVGMACLSSMDTGTGMSETVLYITLFGIGLGVVLSVFTLISQSAAEPSIIGAATASFQLFRQLGATIGLSVMGAILQHRLARSSLVSVAPLNDGAENLSDALQGVFQIGLSASVIALLFGLFIIEVPLRSVHNQTHA